MLPNTGAVRSTFMDMYLPYCIQNDVTSPCLSRDVRLKKPRPLLLTVLPVYCQSQFRSSHWKNEMVQSSYSETEKVLDDPLSPIKEECQTPKRQIYILWIGTFLKPRAPAGYYMFLLWSPKHTMIVNEKIICNRCITQVKENIITVMNLLQMCQVTYKNTYIVGSRGASQLGGVF